MTNARSEMSCRELVELVTDYLEGPGRRTSPASSTTWQGATAAPLTWSRCG